MIFITKPIIMKSLYISIFLFFSVFAFSQECSKFLDFVVPQNNNDEVEVFTHLQYPSLDASCSVTHFGVDAWTNDIYSTPVINHAYGIVEQSGLYSDAALGYYSLIRYPNCSEFGENKYVLILHYSGSPVAQGLSVYCGDTIGYTGSSNGVDHVHLEVRDFNDIKNSSVLGCSGSPNIYGAGDYSSDPIAEEYDNPCNPPRGFWTEINQQTDLVIGSNTEYLQIRIPQSGTMNFSGITKSDIQYLRINTKERVVVDFENIQNEELRFKIDVSEFASSTEHKTIPLGFTLKLNDRWYNYTAKVNVVGEFSDVQYSMMNLFSSEIQEAVDLGLFKGSPDGNFLPLNTLTKGQAAKVIVTTAFKLGLITIQDYTSGPFYADMNSSNEFYPFVFTLEHYLSQNNVATELDVPLITLTNNFNPNAPISIGLFGSWLKYLLVLTENGDGIDRDSEINIPNDGNNAKYVALTAIKNIFIKDKEGILESVLNDLGSPELTITRSMAAKALVNGYKVRFNELNENEALFRSSSSSTNPFEGYSIIGDKQEIIQSVTQEAPPAYANLNITMTLNQDSIVLGPEDFLDSNGIPFNFYWVSNDGILNSLTEFKNKVSWKPPISTNVKIYKIDLFINHVSGTWGQAEINVTVYPSDNFPDAASINLSASLSQTSADPLEVITVSGTATYDNGLPVEVSTVYIETGNYTYAAETDANGNFTKLVPAPETTQNIQVSVDDGTFSDNVILPITIISPTSPNGWEHHYSDHFRYVSTTPYDQSDRVGVDWSRVYTWIEFDQIGNQVQARLEYYRPNGTFLTSFDSDWSPSGDDVTAFSFYIDMEGESISDHQGTWNTKIYARAPGQNFQFVKSLPFHLSHQFVENKICEDVDFSNCSTGTNICPVINEKNVFTQDDAQVTVYSHNRDIGNELPLKAEFIEPNGDIYETIYDLIPYPGPDAQDWFPNWYQAFHQPIAGYPMENKTGKWKVKCYSEDPFGNWDLEYEDPFYLIESVNVNPITDVFKTSGNYEGEDIYLSITASDNTYLKSTTVYWRVNGGNWTSIGWSNLNNSSFGDSDFLVDYPFIEGDVLEYRTEALDNSGNFGGSQLKSFTIKDNDTDAPEITNFTVAEVGGDGNGMIQDNETFNVSFDVFDVSGVQTVQTIIDGVTIALNSNYEVTLSNYSPGTHFATVIATDNDNSPETRIKYFSFEVCNEIAYLDIDGDGYGDPNQYYYDCEISEGYTDNGLDCFDTLPTINNTPLESTIPLYASFEEDYQHFGFAVEANSTDNVVSSLYESLGSWNAAGAVYIYNKNGELKQKLQGNDAYYMSLFGKSLVLDEKYLFIGTNESFSDGLSKGSVYVYEKVNETWTFVQKIIANDGEAYDYFGRSIAYNDSLLIIGAHHDDHSNTSTAGSAYIYELTIDTFEFIQKIVSETPSESERFGNKIKYNGSEILITTFGKTGYIFTHDNGSWQQNQKINFPTTSYFSASVDLSENLIAVAGTNISTYQKNSGSNQYILSSSIFSPTSDYQNFASYLEIKGEYLYTNTSLAPVWTNQERSQILKYKRVNNSYILQKQYFVEDTSSLQTISNFDIHNDRILIGASGDSNSNFTSNGKCLSLETERDLPLNIKVILKEFYNETSGLMNDSLRENGLIQYTEPYSDMGESTVGGAGYEFVENQILTVEGNDAIVDWVHVDLVAMDSTIIQSFNGLLQRDGDIVHVDGKSPLLVDFSNNAIVNNPVNVRVKHYNHFSLYSDDPIYLQGCSNSIDLTDTSICTCNYVLNTKNSGEGSLRSAIFCGVFENVYFSNAVANDTIVITSPFWFDIDQNKILDTEGRNVTIHKTQGFYLFSLDIGKQLTLKDMNIYLPYSNWVSNKSTFINTSGSLVLDNVVVKVLPTEDDIKIYAPGILSTRNAVRFEKIE